MTRNEQIETLGSLYLLYRNHVKNLQKAGYSHKEAFWLNFICLSFLPWDEQSENEINLSQILRLYLGIYVFNIDKKLKPENVPSFMELLIDRYYMAKDIALIEDPSRLRKELGRLALANENNAKKMTEAGSIIINTAYEWMRQRQIKSLPCRLVDDIQHSKYGR